MKLFRFDVCWIYLIYDLSINKGDSSGVITNFMVATQLL